MKKIVNSIDVKNYELVKNEYKVVAFMCDYDNFSEYKCRFAMVYDCINTLQVINDIYNIINDCDSDETIECEYITINGTRYNYSTICKMHNNYKCA